MSDTTTYDRYFEEGSRLSGVPVAIYRTIARRESGGDPTLINPRTRATGLMQIMPVVREGWNRRVATPRGKVALREKDLLDPQTNVAVASWLMRDILTTFARFPGLFTDWDDRRSVELFIFGYHAGHYGLAKAVERMVSHGVTTKNIGLGDVLRVGKAIGAFPYAKDDPALLDTIAAYDRKTADLYFGTPTPRMTPSRPALAGTPRKAPGLGALLGLGAAVALGIAIAGKRREEGALAT